jgi:hypothetical protein
LKIIEDASTKTAERFNRDPLGAMSDLKPILEREELNIGSQDRLDEYPEGHSTEEVEEPS